MEDLLAICSNISKLKNDVEKLTQKHFDELDVLFYGIPPPVVDTDSVLEKSVVAPSPQQTKKRPKRLSAFAEDDGEDVSSRQSARMSNAQLLAFADEVQLDNTATLMPPPSSAPDTTLNSGRPQRAAKLRVENKLKELPLNSKLRRPTNEPEVKVKLEHEQRPSQAASTRSQSIVSTEEPLSSSENNQNIAPPEIIANKSIESNENEHSTREFCIKVKREKVSSGAATTLETTVNNTSKATKPNTTTMNETAENVANSTAATKKLRKKKHELHRPIKVERFSDLDKNSPVATRTRKGSTEKRSSGESQKVQNSIYEDAAEIPPIESEAVPSQAVNATVVLGSAINDATVVLGQAIAGDATIVLGTAASDATFQAPHAINNDQTFAVENTAKVRENSLSSNKSMVTAKDSLMTEDESLVAETPVGKSVTKLPVPTPIKSMKMPSRTHELFNPLIQSPVKMRVEAFENAASAQSLRSKTTKNLHGTPGAGVVGKLQAPVLGRFLTPTQASSVLPMNSVPSKKAPLSASKVQPLIKSASGGNLKSTHAGSTKTLSRENSGDDFRKGLHQLAEDRKRQREQKHLLAAQQREAKERERAERIAKLAKEREEKRIKKLQEQERKKQEAEEALRKLRQEEADVLKKAKAKAIQDQEREMLQQMKQSQQMSGSKSKSHMLPPPPPKSKYTFEMLHQDDSTDEEGKVSYKRPAVPSWSRSHVRGAAISIQTHCPTTVIDSFFSVAPMTPDLKIIFPNIDPRHLQRNSSVMWNTPPRYSELPKY